MKHKLLLITTILFYLIGCSTHMKFILTGKKYPPRADNSEVKVIAPGVTDGYENIGIAEVGASTKQKRVEGAMQLARLHGGDVIMQDKASAIDIKRNINSDGYKIQSFLVLKKKEMVVPKIESKIEESNIEASPKIENSNENLPRATYKLLTEEFLMLKGEKFRGTLYPKGYKKVPGKLKSKTGKGKRFLLATSKKGRYRLYIIVPADMTEIIKEKIKNREKIDFVYTPVDLYKIGRTNYPVLELIENIDSPIDSENIKE